MARKTVPPVAGNTPFVSGSKRHFMNALIASLLPTMGLLFGHVFMWSNNVHMFDTVPLVASLAALLLCGTMLFLFSYYVVARVLQNIFPETLAYFLFSAYIAVVFIFFSFSMIDYTHIVYKNRLYSPILALMVCFIIYKRWTKFLALFSVIMLSMAFFSLTKNYIYNVMHGAPFPVRESNIILKNKPNIYLFWLESYHDFDILKKFYNYENKVFSNYLLDNNFILQNGSYSGGSYTLMSMSQLFLCDNELKREYNLMVQDGAKAVRDLLGGDESNFVLRTLKNNGYTTTFLTRGSYYFMTRKGVYLDDTDLDFGISWLMYPILSVNYYAKFDLYSFRDQQIHAAAAWKGDLHFRVKTAMARAKATGKPLFVSFKGGADHAYTTHRWENREKFINSGWYQRKVSKSDPETLAILEYIIASDPNALILLLGDHGAWSYRYFPSEKAENFEKYQVSPQDFADDQFRVLFAYRLPGGKREDISRGLYMNNSTLFLHVFSWLAEDASILTDRKPCTSALGCIKIVDGVLQPL